MLVRTLAVTLALTSCAIVEDDGEEVLDEEVGVEGAGLLWYTTITREYFLPSDKIRTETRKLFKSEAEWVAHFGTPSPGIDFSRDWAIFYTPGIDNLEPGDRARLVKVTLSATGKTVSITTRLESNGDCAWRSARPFITATIRKPASNPALKRFYDSDTTPTCN